MFKQEKLYKDLETLIKKKEDIQILSNRITKFIDSERFINTDIYTDMILADSLEYTDRSQGLEFRLKALQEHIQRIIKGDFIVIAGGVDCGKTSFLASELSYMGTQLEGDDYILWMSNEGTWKSILPRLYCAALDCTAAKLREFPEQASKEYIKLMNGNRNRIKLVDIQGWSAKDIENVLKKNPPKLLAIDLLDHVDGFDKYNNKENATERYNKLYQWAREVATQYCPVLGVSQLNGDGAEQMFPSLSMMRGSRVDKQAAATAVLMIGSSTDNTRYLSMPKNKINENKFWQTQVRFDPAKSRFI